MLRHTFTALRSQVGGHLERPRILLADDNAELLDHLAQLLGRDWDIVAECADGESTLKACKKFNPEFLVLDISMGEVSGIEVARKLTEEGRYPKILFLTVHEEREFVCAAFAAGGAGYVVKSRMALDLVPALAALKAGRVFVSPTLQTTT